MGSVDSLESLFFYVKTRSASNRPADPVGSAWETIAAAVESLDFLRDANLSV